MSSRGLLVLLSPPLKHSPLAPLVAAYETLADSLINGSMTYLIQSRTLQTASGSEKLAREKGKVSKAILKESERMCERGIQILIDVEGLEGGIDGVLESEEGENST